MRTPEDRADEINSVLEDLWHGVKIRKPYLTSIQREVRALAGAGKKAEQGKRDLAAMFPLMEDMERHRVEQAVAVALNDFIGQVFQPSRPGVYKVLASEYSEGVLDAFVKRSIAAALGPAAAKLSR